ncbi:AhpD family alkylhydroperoxidase [Archangium gephyra]|uniref:4-carboxymuconolactone decarboxylase domain/alkylhydroperoxidase AhpD family core domain protein n=1 Tax=Archangium gephyra TaxID=48 RepID=A0AAC8TE35_9BACT|nr:carboxymuconolactone decarboxylase family protein [Archangium gephyra]AKJ02487.1 4-carboxymuconolactone decarboxylase domain/alkylhydroperoxidase AhpD family core domain protein [Archangium gephyra]REG28591.1 AhpD family alkylhydroperoxidase [Archangium gephyra]
MNPRLNPYTAEPELLKAMISLSEKVESSGLEKSLLELVKIRASQLNGCAFCIHMHTRDARAHGETEDRIYLLNAWRESPLYTDRERAALGWTEALTLVSQTHAPDADYEALRAHFSKEEVVKLTLMITTINAWNRIAIGFRSIHPVASRSDAA